MRTCSAAVARPEAQRGLELHGLAIDAGRDDPVRLDLKGRRGPFLDVLRPVFASVAGPDNRDSELPLIEARAGA
jgi:hypothetical protein